jgi:hypothetical protein
LHLDTLRKLKLHVGYAALPTDLQGDDERVVVEGDLHEGPLLASSGLSFRPFDAGESRGFLNVNFPAPRLAIIALLWQRSGAGAIALARLPWPT